MALLVSNPKIPMKSEVTVKKEIKDAAPDFKMSPSYYSELEMDFESSQETKGSFQPVMSTHTEQLTKMKVLPPLDPKDPAYSKDGANERKELTFEKLINASSVIVPGLKQPFESKADLGSILSSKPLVLRGDGKTVKKVERLAEVKAEALAQAKDPLSRNTINIVMSEDILLKSGDNLSGKDSSCLSALGKKKPGDSWKFTQEEQGVKLNYTCTFEGWGELSGKKVIVVGVKSDKQRVRRQQPNGVPAIAEMSGEGKILFLPEGPEALMRMKTDIDVEPTEEEIARLKASKGEISRNKSKMKHTSFLYPL
jgi:hypothetical protein